MTDTENSIAIVDSTGHVAPVWTDAREQLIRDNFVPKNAPKDMIEAFLALARHRGLAPEEKHVYLIERGGKWTIQTGIDGFRLIADRTGTYAGSDPAAYTYHPDGGVESATVTVWKLVQGQRCPFGATAYVDDYTTRKLLWASMPRVMVAKVAESAALRKAFPAQLAGVYEASELDQAEITPATIREAPHRITGSTAPERATHRILASLTVRAAEANANRDQEAWKALIKEVGKDVLLWPALIAQSPSETHLAWLEKAANGKGQALRPHFDRRRAELSALVEAGDVADHDNTADDDDVERDPDTGEVIPDWVGRVAEGDQLAGMPTPTRGRPSDQIAGIN